MKVFAVKKKAVEDGFWKGRIVISVSFSNDVEDVGTTYVIAKIMELYPHCRYIVLEGDVPVYDTEMFNLLCAFWAWYKTRSLEQVLIKIKPTPPHSIIGLTPRAMPRPDYREMVSVELVNDWMGVEKVSAIPSSSEFELTKKDAVSFSGVHGGNVIALRDLLGALTTINTWRPTILISSVGDVFRETRDEVLSWTGLEKILDIRLIKG